MEVTPDTILERIEGKAVPGWGTYNSEGTMLGHRSPEEQKDLVDQQTGGWNEATEVGVCE